MIQTNELNLQEGIDYKLLEDARLELKWSMERVGKECEVLVPEGTVKNILTGKTRNPGSETLRYLCDALNVPIEKVVKSNRKTEIENKGIRIGDESVIALKEIYEMQIANMKETNEVHINNIRAHYEQHHEDLKENYERRLADKREIIETKNEHVKTLERECKHAKLFSWVCVAVLVSLLIAEVMNPNLGWIQF